MVLAISGGFIYLMFLLVVGVVVVISISRTVKKSSKSKQASMEKMSEINSFILQYEANKARNAAAGLERETPNNVIAAQSEAKPLVMKTHPYIDEATKTRIRTLHEDAEMPAEKIAEKTGVELEEVERIIRDL